MHLQNLALQNFKNHETVDFTFSPVINCFTGNNGTGKTNILDALHYLSLGKSFLNTADVLNIREGEPFFSIRAEVVLEDKIDVLTLGYEEQSKKIFKKNDKTYGRLADHVGYLPSVMISPYDSNLISDSGESRRKFLDGVLSQMDSTYLHELITYQKTVQQRNALLKYFAKNRVFDLDNLSIYDQPLANNAQYLHQKRTEFIQDLVPYVQHFYEIISGGKEKVGLQYQSALHTQAMDDLLAATIEKDRQQTYTTAGVHKDDLLFLMNGKPLRKIGSQGQQKTFLISLKLAQMKGIQDFTSKKALLLLDDIFDKLDETRVRQLIKLISAENFGQMFITDTDPARTENIVRQITNEAKVFHL